MEEGEKQGRPGNTYPHDVIHVIGVPRPSPFFVLFCFRILHDILNANQRAKNEGGLGTRLQVDNHQDNCSQPIDYHLTVGRSGHNTKVTSKLATCEDIYTSGCGFLFNSASLFVVRFTTLLHGPTGAAKHIS